MAPIENMPTMIDRNKTGLLFPAPDIAAIKASIAIATQMPPIF
jgi:hypothetical protein